MDSIGHLKKVVVNPGDGRVTALVVPHAGLPSRDFVIPVEAVESATDFVVRLKFTKEQVEAQHRTRIGSHLFHTGAKI
ncbi:MAG TPA: PRC-barrel domain-containing protein [Chloroflexia bacterium]|nr:PRC-barrel domain-containing protein [Chloroflexia bacterium]